MGSEEIDILGSTRFYLQKYRNWPKFDSSDVQNPKFVPTSIHYPSHLKVSSLTKQ
jgi:hypothetical protein